MRVIIADGVEEMDTRVYRWADAVLVASYRPQSRSSRRGDAEKEGASQSSRIPVAVGRPR